MESPDSTTKEEQVEHSIKISLKNNSEREQITRKLLEQLLAKYDLRKWIICREVVIEQDARAHSFPIITLSAWNAQSEESLLAQFLHEQIHWIETGNEDKMDQAIEELKILYPEVPVGRPEGAINEKSTYRHLIVCRLEFLALGELLGEDRAKEIILGNKNYTWIRRTTIENGSNIDPIIEKYFPEALK